MAPPAGQAVHRNDRPTCADWLVRPVPSRSRTSRVLLDATATANIPAIWSPAEEAGTFRGEEEAEEGR